jgi:hypothetical protein
MNRTKNFGSYLNALNSQVSDVAARNEITSISAGAITGDSLAENVTLFGSAIQSSDYVSGSTGWKIDGTGVAEFADVYVRGDINAETGTIGYWNISSPGVTRTIGDRVLFGTFLESNDFGQRDDEITEGVYVGLFKSYFEDASPVTSRTRTSNLATILIKNNAYQPGDRVFVTINEDTSFNNGGLPVTVIASTSESITYYNVGSDFPTYDVNGIPASTVTTGEAVLYNPDVAGLYIRDYGKTALDYGYFSNQGVAYVSASRVNLVHNPSFEYNQLANVTAISGSGSVVTYTASNSFMAGQTVTITDSDVEAYNLTNVVIASANSTHFTVSSTATGTGNTVANAVSLAASNSAWKFGNTASNTTISTFRYSNLGNQLLTTSTFAGYGSWSATAPSAARYFRGTINYSKGVDYNVFDLDKVLYLSYDTHFNVTPYYAEYSSISATSSNCTITTNAAHGFSVGDIVVIDFSLIDLSGQGAEFVGNTSDPSLWYTSANYNIAAVEVLAKTNTTFTYANPAANAISGTVVPTANDGRDLRIYKIPYGAVDLSQITFEYSNGQATVVANVVTDMTTASWTSNQNKYLSLDPINYFLQYISPTEGLSPLQPVGSVPLMVDSNKLRLDYSTKDAAGYAAKNNITLNLPWVVYAQRQNAAANVYTSTTAFQMTSVVAVSAISGNGTTVTYTASNNFAVGDRVTITGATTSAYNLSNVAVASVIGTAPNYTGFTVTNSATGTTSTATATGYKGVTTFIDAVSLSTEPIPFFGDSSDDYSWEDPTLNSTDQISLQDTKKWLDINLDDQTGSISNLDYLGFKQSRLSVPMLTQPKISTTTDYSSDIGSFHSPHYDYENLEISSGAVSTINLDGTYYNTFESKINLSSSRVKSASQIISTYDDGNGGTNSASITAVADVTNTSKIDLRADTVNFYGDAKVDMNSGLYATFIYSNDALLPISFQNNVSTYADLSVGGVFTAESTADFQDYATFTATTPTYSTTDSANTGVFISNSNFIAVQRDSATPLFIHRQTNDGTLIDFRRATASVGSISVSSGTVSYNAFMGSHYTELENLATSNILRGTVVESLNELVSEIYFEQERLPKVKISDTVSSTKVYGVYVAADVDEDTENGCYVAALGASWVRVASGVTVSRGDLLDSNGDGCAKVQSDDVIRSSTIGKVTSATPIETYEDGSYLVPCVLYCG